MSEDDWVARDCASPDSPAEAARIREKSYLSMDSAFNLDDRLTAELLYPSLPNMLGLLGEVQPVSSSTTSWAWVTQELQRYPRAFAQHTETAFIHRGLYSNTVPQSIRTAFGLCSACMSVTESNRSMLFRSLEAEALQSLLPVSNSDLLDDLSRLQAIVLYQSMRLFYGDLSQRIVAEQQRTSVEASGIKLLQRADDELRDAHPDWTTWLLAESIRRTVMVAFMLYGVYSVYKYGVCTSLPMLIHLPVSTQPACWRSGDLDQTDPEQNGTMKYGDFTALWVVSPRRKLEPFEKLLLVACKGLDKVEAHSISQSVDPVN